MPIRRPRPAPRRLRPILASLAASAAIASALAVPAGAAESYQAISGEGSSWAAGAIDAMRVNVKQFGITVGYKPNGSTAGRAAFIGRITDFAASDIPFQFKPEDGAAEEKPVPGSYAYMPVTAGGTSFMYNLKINGQRVTNLRLSGENVTKIFTSVITSWDDPALAADNPGLTLPKRKITPVVRSDGSGSSAQFTSWMINQHGGLWQDYCQRSGRAPACGQTSFYPPVSGMIAQSGDLGVAGYVAQNFGEGAIGYINYSYSLGSNFPVAKMLNKAGFYTEPTPNNVAVSLLKARINEDASSPDYLTQQLDGVYNDTDQRNYPLSSYSYLILPTQLPPNGDGSFNAAKGRTMGAFSYYAMCQAQEQSESLGYSPMPINLVRASFDQIKKIPGVVQQDIDVTKCKNPTFSPDGTNLLAKNAKFPLDCDKRGPTQCETGTGGLKGSATPVKTAAKGGATRNTNGNGGSAGAGSGSGGAGTGGAGSGSSGATAGGPGSEEVCDPETGVCTVQAITGDSEGSDGGAGGSEQALPPAALSSSSRWSGAQTLILLVGLLTLALVLAPGLAWRALASREPK